MTGRALFFALVLLVGGLLVSADAQSVIRRGWSIGYFANGSASAPSLSFGAATTRGFFNDTANAGIGIAIAGAQVGFISADTVRFSGSGGNATIQAQANTASLQFGSALDVQLSRDAANTLALRNGTAAQTFFVGATNASGAIRFGDTLFANLGTPSNGTITFCSDCTFANPCAGAGTGAMAKRLAGAWRCD